MFGKKKDPKFKDIIDEQKETDEVAEDIDDDEEEEKEAKAPKQYKNQILISNPIHTYKFWFKIFAFALLLIVGLMLIFDKKDATKIVLMFTGAVFSLFALIRIIPLMKTLQKGWSKAIHLLEILFDFVVGVFLIALCVKQFGDSSKGFVSWCSEHYNLLIGLVLWLRGFVYFTSTILFGEKTDKAKYFAHIGVITFGAFLLGYKIDAVKIALVIGILALICALVIGVEAGWDYGNYRKKVKETTEWKDKQADKKKKKEQGKEAPAKEEEPVIEPEKEDMPIIEPENNDDRPFVS